MNKATALDSLTANYTDSDNEQDSDEDSDSGAPEVTNSTEDTPVSSGERYSVKEKPSKLVSYADPEGWDDDLILDSDDSYDGLNITDEKEKSAENKKSSDVNSRPYSPISFHRSLQSLSPEEIELPPEAPGRCSNALQEKIAELYSKKLRESKDMNAFIQRRKDFRNPSIYEKLISYCGIDELGTNYPPEIFDPHSWGPESFYEELAKRQKEEMDKREKEKKERTKVEFISGTAKKPTTELPSSDNGKRKSKWDVGAIQAAVQNLKPATLITQAPSVFPIASATGTKPTVISAFGTISKKAKQ